MVFIRVNRKVIFSILLSIILLCIIVITFSHLENRMLAKEYNLLSEKYSSLENKYNASQRTNLDTVISEYVKDNIMPDNRKFDYKCEAHKILGMDEIDGVISVYLYLCFKGYRGTKLEAGASVPMLVVLKKEDNEYIVLNHKNTGKGAYYAPSITAMFPEKYAERAINAQSNGIAKELGNEVKKQEDEWFNMMNSNAEHQSNLIETNNDIKLSKLYFSIPINWTKRITGNEISFEDEKKQIVGGIERVGYYGNYNAALPNHSETLSIKNINTCLGKGKLFALERSNPASSGSNVTWNEFHAIIPIYNKNLAYDIWVKGSKDILLNILKSIQF